MCTRPQNSGSSVASELYWRWVRASPYSGKGHHPGLWWALNTGRASKAADMIHRNTCTPLHTCWRAHSWADNYSLHGWALSRERLFMCWVGSVMCRVWNWSQSWCVQTQHTLQPHSANTRGWFYDLTMDVVLVWSAGVIWENYIRGQNKCYI